MNSYDFNTPKQCIVRVHFRSILQPPEPKTLLFTMNFNDFRVVVFKLQNPPRTHQNPLQNPPSSPRTRPDPSRTRQNPPITRTAKRQPPEPKALVFTMNFNDFRVIPRRETAPRNSGAASAPSTPRNTKCSVIRILATLKHPAR